jgi:hypothetical protein
VKIDSFCTEQAQQSCHRDVHGGQGCENGMARAVMKRRVIDGG